MTECVIIYLKFGLDINIFNNKTNSATNIRMLSLFAVLSIGLVYGQQSTCVYDGPTNAYFLNLTRISDWTLELEQPNHFYYYVWFS